MPDLPQQKAVKVVTADQFVQYVEVGPVGVAQNGMQSLDECYAVTACVGRRCDGRELLVAEYLYNLSYIAILQMHIPAV
jgi:hypothetical protein